ncbi:phage holin [Actinomycetes bacterium NPDC127524]
MINWKVRFRNRLWMTGFLSQLFIVIEILLVGAHAIGLTDFKLTEDIKGWVLSLVNAVAALMATVTNIQDPTTKGYSDSSQAKDYEHPR